MTEYHNGSQTRWVEVVFEICNMTSVLRALCFEDHAITAANLSFSDLNWVVLSGISFVMVSTFLLDVLVIVIFTFSLHLSLTWFLVVFTLSIFFVYLPLDLFWYLHFSSICLLLGSLWVLHYRYPWFVSRSVSYSLYIFAQFIKVYTL